ncbi:MAG: transporter substrate-binding domain-containing protein, partial [Candidatus Methanomethylophilaceae archaeon]|nr:transporter substrate-binding domain-containing protein [Candidatus Methanomethylophilaceae archaeon]
MNKKILAIMMVAVFILSSCGIMVSSTDESDAARRTIVVETSPDFAPYDYYYGTEFVGIDMDIIRAIGMDLDYNIQFKQNDFNSIIVSIENKKCDIGASGFTITEERKESVNFTDPYAEIKQVVVAKSSKNFTSESDLVGKKIGVQTSTSGEYYVKDTLGIEPTRLDTYSVVVESLKSGKIDCEVVDEPVARAQCAEHPELKIYDILNADIEYYGFVFNKGDDALLLEFNNSLNKLKADGTVDRIIRWYADNGFRTDTPSYFNKGPTLFVIADTSVPYSYKNNGLNAGIDADIMNAVGRDLGYRVRFINVAAKDITTRLSEAPYYIAIGGLVKSDLGGDYKFSPTTSTDKLVVVSPKGEAATSPESIAGKKVAVLKDSPAIAYAEGKGAITTEYPSANYAINSVKNGDVDYAVLDYVGAESYMYGYKDYVEINDVLTDAPVIEYGFLFHSSETELINLVNESIVRLTDSTIAEIEKYYADNGYNPNTPSYYDDTDNSFWGKLWDRI